MDVIDKRFAEITETSRLYSKAQANVEYLDNFRHSKIAILMQQAQLAGHTSSAAQEREARAHLEYRELLLALQSATEEALKLKWELTIAQMRFDHWRTAQSTKRAEMQIR